jgi:hypothetical protein
MPPVRDDICHRPPGARRLVWVISSGICRCAASACRAGRPRGRAAWPMVNWQAGLIDSPELSPDAPASDRSVGVPAAALREPTLVPPGRLRRPGHGRRTGTSASRRAGPALLGRDSGSAFRLRGARLPCHARTRPTSRLAEKYRPGRHVARQHDWLRQSPEQVDLASSQSCADCRARSRPLPQGGRGHTAGKRRRPRVMQRDFYRPISARRPASQRATRRPWSTPLMSEVRKCTPSQTRALMMSSVIVFQSV